MIYCMHLSGHGDAKQAQRVDGGNSGCTDSLGVLYKFSSVRRDQGMI